MLIKTIEGLLNLAYSARNLQVKIKVTRKFTPAEPYDCILPNSNYAPWKVDKGFLPIYNRCKHNTLKDIYRLYELWELGRRVQSKKGDILEVGTWKGGSAGILGASTKHTDAHIYLADTFAGVVKATKHDYTYYGGEHGDASYHEVVKLLDGLNISQYRILKGIFPDDTADEIEGKKFKLCHIDVDTYQGAKDIFEWVYPRLLSGGLVVFDDYGFRTTQGVAKMVNELKGKHLLIHNLNGHAIVVKQT